MENIFSVTTDGKWWKGEISMRYNLLTLVKIVGALLLLAAIGFGLYWFGVAVLTLLQSLWYGICWIATGIWSGLCWLASGIWSILCWLASQWMWLLGLLLAALIGWLLTKVDWKSSEAKSDSKRSWSWIWWLLGAILLLLLALMLVKGCNNSTESAAEPAPMSAPVVITAEQFDEAFDKVVIARAYLDGVQNGVGKKVALVGLKFVDGRPVTDMIFQGRTYDEAKAIIAADWRELVTANVHVQLSEQELVAITLYAMRNGKYGFLKSDFLKAVNAGDRNAAMELNTAKGTKRQLRDEGKQYLWVLRNLWNGNISVDDLIDMPMFSYKKIAVEQMYDNGKPVFNSTLSERLNKGANRTPREALEL